MRKEQNDSMPLLNELFSTRTEHGISVHIAMRHLVDELEILEKRNSALTKLSLIHATVTPPSKLTIENIFESCFAIAQKLPHRLAFQLVLQKALSLCIYEEPLFEIRGCNSQQKSVGREIGESFACPRKQVSAASLDELLSVSHKYSGHTKLFFPIFITIKFTQQELHCDTVT